MQQNNRCRPEPPPLPKRKGCPPPNCDPPCPPPRVAPGCAAPQKTTVGSFLDMLGISGGMDSDRILVLGLLLLLSGEECDRMLLMALLYILI